MTKPMLVGNLKILRVLAAFLSVQTKTPVIPALYSHYLSICVLRLDTQDIRTCTLLSKEFNIFIRSSIVLQYLIACHAAGVVDNPRCKLSYAERYEALLKREKAWCRFQPVFGETFAVPNEPRFDIHKLSEGVYLLGDSNRRDLRCCTLPSTPDEVPQWATIHGHGPKRDWNGVIIDVGMAVYEHDLIVNVVSFVHKTYFMECIFSIPLLD